MNWDRMRDCGNYNLGKRKKRRKTKKVAIKGPSRIIARFQSELKRRKTLAEAVFEAFLKHEKIAFEFQKIVYTKKKVYIVDFYLPFYNIIVEVDGGYHAKKGQVKKDVVRENNLKKCGFTHIFRFKNKDVMSSGFNVLFHKKLIFLRG